MKKIKILFNVENAKYPTDEITKFVDKYIVGWISNRIRIDNNVCCFESNVANIKDKINLDIEQTNENFAKFYKLAGKKNPIKFNVEFI